MANLLQNAYQMVLFPKKVFSALIMRFFFKKNVFIFLKAFFTKMRNVAKYAGGSQLPYYRFQFKQNGNNSLRRSVYVSNGSIVLIWFEAQIRCFRWDRFYQICQCKPLKEAKFTPNIRFLYMRRLTTGAARICNISRQRGRRNDRWRESMSIDFGK